MLAREGWARPFEITRCWLQLQPRGDVWVQFFRGGPSLFLKLQTLYDFLQLAHDSRFIGRLCYPVGIGGHFGSHYQAELVAGSVRIACVLALQDLCSGR